MGFYNSYGGGGGFTNPYALAMLEEEKKKAARPPGQVQPGDPLAQFQIDPEAAAQAQAQLEPLEGKLDRRRAMAQELMGTAMPEGKTVGPSGTYVVNPYEQAAAGIKRLVGGYQGRRANKLEEGEVAEARGRVTAAEADAAKKKQGLEMFLASRAMGREDKQDANAARELDLKAQEVTQDERALAVDEAEMEVQFAADAEGNPIGYVMQYDPELKRAVPTNPTTGEKVDLTGATEMDTGAAGSTNAPERYIDVETGDEYFLSWDKGQGRYKNAFTGKYMSPEEYSERPLTREKEMTESQMQAAWQKYTERNADTLALMHDMEAAEESFRDLGWDGKGSVFNWFTKQGNVIGDVARLAADGFEDGAPTQDAYAAAQTVYNAISRLRAGLSQTVAEISRIKKETGEDPLVSSAVMMKYWDRLGGKLANDIKIQQASITPRMRQAYSRYGNGPSETPVDPRSVEQPQERKTRSGRGIGGNQKPDVRGLTPEEIDNMSEEELRARGLI